MDKKKILCVKRKTGSFLLISSLLIVLCISTAGFAGCGKQEEHTHAFTEQNVKQTYLAEEATCTQAAKYYYSCACGEKGTQPFEIGNALGHNFGEWVTVTPATEEKDGLEERTCARCEEKEEKTIPATKHTHNYVETVIAPTCTAGGYTLHKCKCGEEYKDNETAALGHNFGEWQTVTPATEEKDGLEERTCARCEEKEEKTIPATKHTHNYAETVVEPTCTTGGYTLHKCVCGEEYKDNEKAALGHNFGEWQTVTPATEEKDGLEERTCARCEEKEEKTIPSLIHTHKFTETVIAPTCTERGYTLHKCKCGEEYKDNETAALGHNFGEWQTITPATEEKEGLQERTCARCEEKEERAIPSLIHTHKFTETVIAPTCTAGGYILHKCVCGEQYRDNEKSALGHAYVVEKQEKQSDGRYELTLACKVCDGLLFPVTDKGTTVSATCREGGYTQYNYSYQNIVNGSEREVKSFIRLNYTDKTDYHAIGETADNSTLRLKCFNLSTCLPVYEYNDDIQRFFDQKVLEWNEYTPKNCKTSAPAVFKCLDCKEKIVIGVSGKHSFVVKNEINCISDGCSYKECSVCKTRKDYKETVASGHTYIYVNGSFNEVAMTAQFRCLCGNVNEGKAVFIKSAPSDSCRHRAYKEYKTTLDNGIGGQITYYFRIEDTNEVLYHTINSVARKYVAYNIATGQPRYEQNNTTKKLLDNGTLVWNEGKPANCSTYMAAVFTCDVCQEKIVIALSGEHLTISGGDEEATCTKRGAAVSKCIDCKKDIEQDPTAAKGHAYVPETKSWNNFLASDIKNGQAVSFKCGYCGDLITLATRDSSPVETVGVCVVTYTTKYDFYEDAENRINYSYKIEDENGNLKTVTFKYSWSYVNIVGKHVIGSYNGEEVTALPFLMSNPSLNEYEWSSAFAYFFDNGTLRWNEGKPDNCQSHALAVFKCEKCGEQIVISVSGEHYFDKQKITKPTETTEGKVEEHCAYCDKWFEKH